MPGPEWDHNAYYHRLLLRQLPPRFGRALDVGCGAGGLAAALARRAGEVDALDRSPVMLAGARRVVPGNVRCVQADVMDVPLPRGGYDVITSVSALHHLPLEPALARLRDALRPGGVLVAISLPRREPRDLPVELAAVALHQVFGVALAGLRRAYPRRTWLAPEPTHDVMPVLDPQLTTTQVRRRAGTVLPGVRVRRLVFWRYLLVWAKPVS